MKTIKEMFEDNPGALVVIVGIVCATLCTIAGIIASACAGKPLN